MVSLPIPIVSPTVLANKKILLGINGGVTAYKAAFLIRLLTELGAQVQVVVTHAALDFIGVATLQALSTRPVWGPDFQDDARAMPHIDLTRDIDAVLIAPCTANFMAKLAQGMADDLLSTLCLARQKNLPLFIAPAMNVEMWEAPSTQRNRTQLIADGIRLIGPMSGVQACGELGAGRMSEPSDIVEILLAKFTAPLLKGRQIVITAGPTFEAIDPVRGITNRSSGKMGYALARACVHAGGEVTLVSGPTALPTPFGLNYVAVESAQQMHHSVHCVLKNITRLPTAIFISVAAVADWRAASIAPQKIKKSSAHNPFSALEWRENPDILASVASLANAPYCVGFAAESEDIIPLATEKRLRKNIPLIIANCGPDTFGKDHNHVVLIDALGQTEFAPMDKTQLAAAIVVALTQRLGPF